MKKNIMMIIMSLIISGCAIGGSVNAGSGVGVGIGIGTGVRF